MIWQRSVVAIESAIIFWFKDVDCKSRNKVVSYFKEY